MSLRAITFLQFHVKVRKPAESQKSAALQWIFNSQALAWPERVVEGHGFSRAISG
jgi:hypothetical protein